MTVQLRIVRDGPDYMHVQLTGQYSLDSVTELVDSISNDYISTGKCKRLLLDGSQLTGQMPTMGRYRVTEDVARTVGGKARVALVPSRDVMEHARFTETVAANRGMAVRVFTDEESALEWLLEGCKPEESPPT